MPKDDEEVGKEGGEIDEQRPPLCACESPCTEDI